MPRYHVTINCVSSGGQLSSIEEADTPGEAGAALLRRALETDPRAYIESIREEASGQRRCPCCGRKIKEPAQRRKGA